MTSLFKDPVKNTRIFTMFLIYCFFSCSNNNAQELLEHKHTEDKEPTAIDVSANGTKIHNEAKFKVKDVNKVEKNNKDKNKENAKLDPEMEISEHIGVESRVGDEVNRQNSSLETSKASIKKEIESKVGILKVKKTEKEASFEEMSSYQVACQGCIDKYLGNLINSIQKTFQSTGNRVDLENLLVQDIFAETLKQDLTALAENILSSGSLDPDSKSKILELMKIHQDLAVTPSVKRIHELKSKGQLTKEESAELQKHHDRITTFHREVPFQKLWKMCLEKFDDKTLAREIRKLTLISEYYAKYINAPKTKYTRMRVKINGLEYANTDHSPDAVNRYLFGDPDSRIGTRQKGAIGQFEKEAEIVERKKEQIAKMEEKKEMEREIREERNQRIADGEILSDGLIKKAKYHHNRYKYYYSQMITKCQMSYFNKSGCQRAERDFYRIGKGMHLKKMFDLIEMAQKDKEQEVLSRTKMLRQQYLEGYGGYEGNIGNGKDYSIFDSDEEYGEYADSFGRSGDPWMGNQFSMMPMGGQNGGRVPAGMNGSWGGGGNSMIGGGGFMSPSGNPFEMSIQPPNGMGMGSGVMMGAF